VLGYQRAGSVVVVKLDGAASDVFLVDDMNLPPERISGNEW
jgi:hypothetical protein